MWKVCAEVMNLMLKRVGKYMILSMGFGRGRGQGWQTSSPTFSVSGWDCLQAVVLGFPGRVKIV